MEMGYSMTDSSPATAARPHRLLWQATEPDRLWEAWERVRANNGAAGGDGVTVERFAPFAGPAIDRLSNALRNGLYRPAPARHVEIPKRSGGKRPLDIPAVIDRVAQGAVALTLNPLLDPEMEDASFAYRAGRGVVDAVRRVSSLRRDGFRWVVDGDIERFFETVAHDRLLDCLERHLGDDRLLDLIAHWLEWYGRNGRGLPQGSPLSPLLANIFLDRADEAIATRGLRLVRYADDFVVLAREERDAHKALAKVSALLAEEGLELNEHKTRIRSFDEGFRFLGHVFLRSMIVREVEWGLPDEQQVELGDALNRIAAAAQVSGAGGIGSDQGQDLPISPIEERERIRSPGWRVLYALEKDRRIDATGESIVVRDTAAGGHPILAVHASRVGRIEARFHVELTAGLLELAAAHDIVVARIDGYGETLAEWMPPHMLASHGKRQLSQAQHVLDPSLRLSLARRITIGRMRGQRAILARANQTRKDEEISAGLPCWRDWLRRAEAASSIGQLMGFEGAATAQFWPLLALCLKHDMGFDGKRQRHVGASPFDIVLNLLANALARDVRLALMRHGLHPGISVLHEARDNGSPLAHDLMEEFRAPLIEASAVALVNLRAVDAAMFARNSAGSPGIDAAAYRAVMRGYETALDRTVASQVRNGKVRWRTMIDDQAAALAAHFEGRSTYTPLDLDY